MLGVSKSTIERRLTEGYSLLSSALREEEVAALSAAGRLGDAPARERIMVDESAPRRDVLQTLSELLTTVRKNGVTRFSLEQLDGAARYPASELMAYRLGRVAEWSQPRYQLDERFVEMSLLVDLGEESQSGRWQAKEERFTDLRDVLAEVKQPAVVLLGPPGSGKSTLLRRLELDLAVDGLGDGGASSDAPLTFLVSLNQYRAATPGGPPPAPREWLAERWAARFPKLPPLDEAMTEGDLILLLDGLNEMPHRSQDSYRERIGLWKQFLHEALGEGGGRAVIACRSLDYSAPLSTPSMRVPQVQLEPLDDDRVQAFLDRYSPGNADTLWDHLHESELLDAVRWPFFLRLLVERADETGRLDGGLAALFTSYVRRALVREVERGNPLFAPDGLVDAHDYERLVSGRGGTAPHELPERGILFGRLAALAHGMQVGSVAGESSQVRSSYDDALAMLDCAQSEQVLRAGQELGVLDEDYGAGEVGFGHQLLQEYFAARHLVVRPDPELVRVEWRGDRISPSLDEVIDGLERFETLPRLAPTGWEETTALAAAMSNDPSGFLREVTKTNLALAGRAAAQPGVLDSLSADLLDGLRWALVSRSGDPEADLRDRIACGHVLGNLGDPRFERRDVHRGGYLMPPLIEIPGGRYRIGDDEPIEWPNMFTGKSSTITDHMPRHEVETEAFRIGRFR